MLTKQEKQAIMKEYATKEGDTGSPEVQIAVLTADINKLNGHLSLIHIFQNHVMKKWDTQDKCTGVGLVLMYVVVLL